MAQASAVAQATRSSSSVQSTTGSLTIVKNLLRLSFASVAATRRLFCEDAYTSHKYCGMNVRMLKKQIDKPFTAEESSTIATEGTQLQKAALFAQWIEHGVLEALEHGYLRAAVFAIYAGGDTMEECHPLECYKFRVSYPDSRSVGVNLTREGGEGPLIAMESHKGVERSDIKLRVREMLHRTSMLCDTLDPVPAKHFLSIKLFYNDDITPRDWQPTFFEDATGDVSHPIEFGGKSLKYPFGRVETGFHSVRFKMYTRASSELPASPLAADDATPRASTATGAAQRTSSAHGGRTPTQAPGKSCLPAPASVASAAAVDVSTPPSPAGESHESKAEDKQLAKHKKGAAELLLRVVTWLADRTQPTVTSAALVAGLDMTAYGNRSKQMRVAQGVLKRVEVLGYLKMAASRSQGREILRDKIDEVAPRVREKLRLLNLAKLRERGTPRSFVQTPRSAAPLLQSPEAHSSATGAPKTRNATESVQVVPRTKSASSKKSSGPNLSTRMAVLGIRRGSGAGRPPQKNSQTRPTTGSTAVKAKRGAHRRSARVSAANARKQASEGHGDGDMLLSQDSIIGNPDAHHRRCSKVSRPIAGPGRALKRRRRVE